MSKEIKLEAGQWYRTLANQIVKCINVHPGRGHLLVFKDGSCGYYPQDQAKEHLPDCDSFEWEPPKPVVAPEGWRLLTEGETIKVGDICANISGNWENEPVIVHDEICGEKWNNAEHYAVARRIEIEPKYRPFANAEEFKPHRDKWVKYKQSDAKKTMLCVSFSNKGVTVSVSFMPYRNAFDLLVFEDGTPFGVEVS